jgi:hypothetical protein
VPAQLGVGEAQAAGVGPQRPGDEIEQRGLAAAVGADEAEHLALPQAQRQAVGGADAAEVLVDPGDLQQRCHRGGTAAQPGSTTSPTISAPREAMK